MRHNTRWRRRTLRFESLEERQLLAITVDTLVDEADGSIVDGDISLRDAIAAAPAGETIDFAPALFAGGSAKITLTRGEVLINKALSIVGPDASLLTIDARGNDITPIVFSGGGSRVFRVDDGAATLASVSIENLTLTGADSAGFGGAIRSSESLTVRNTLFFHNGGFDGGAIGSTGPLLVFDSEFYDNHAQSFGGAIHVFNGGTAQIIRASLHDNEAAGPGGAIYFINSLTGMLTVADSLVKNNRSESFGGGIAAQGPVTVTGSSIVNNEAARDGGGIYADKNLTMTGSYVAQNITVDAADPAERGNGGGVYSRLNATISDSTFHHNSAAKNGGGLYFSGPIANQVLSIQVINSTISENDAEFRGGGVYTEWPMLLAHSTVAGNRTETEEISEGGSSSGGGLFYRRVANAGNVQVDHSIVANNIKLTTPDDLGSFSNPSFPSFIALDAALLEVVTGFNEIALGGFASVRGSDPKLGPLAETGTALPGGYRRMIHALALDSPAIDAGDDFLQEGVNGVPLYDGRSDPWARIAGSRIDVGAFESQRSPLDGDYNANGIVDAADYVVWRNTEGSSSDLRADGSGSTSGVPDGIVNDEDRLFWKKNFGNVLQQGGAGSGDQVVEATAGVASFSVAEDEEAPHSNESKDLFGLLAAGSHTTNQVESRQFANREGVAEEVRGDALLAWVSRRDYDAASRDQIDGDERANESAEPDSNAASVDEVFELIGTASNW